MSTISIRLPDELSEELQKESGETGIKKSEIIRKLLKAHLSRRYKSRQKQMSFADAAKKYCGIVSGPKDLSTNKKHMEGFGK